MIAPTQQLLANRVTAPDEVLNAYRSSLNGLVFCPFDESNHFRTQCSRTLRAHPPEQVTINSKKPRKDATKLTNALLTAGFDPTIALDLADRITLWNEVLLTIRPRGTVNTQIATVSSTKVNWHIHDRNPHYTVTLDSPERARSLATLFAPRCSDARTVQEGDIVHPRLWEVAVFRGDVLHSSPAVSGPRTLLRSKIIS